MMSALNRRAFRCGFLLRNTILLSNVPFRKFPFLMQSSAEFRNLFAGAVQPPSLNGNPRAGKNTSPVNQLSP
jgi:hypothetical protein